MDLEAMRISEMKMRSDFMKFFDDLTAGVPANAGQPALVASPPSPKPVSAQGFDQAQEEGL